MFLKYIPYTTYTVYISLYHNMEENFFCIFLVQILDGTSYHCSNLPCAVGGKYVGLRLSEIVWDCFGLCGTV